jgi:hypothetical protein
VVLVQTPRNNKNNTTGNSTQFELLATEEEDTVNDTVGSTSATCATPATSTRGQPLKRTQPYDPESPPRKKSVPTKTKATRTAIVTNGELLLRIETLLKRVEERAERAEKRVEALEEFIHNEVFPRMGTQFLLLQSLLVRHTSTCHHSHRPLQLRVHSPALGWT